MTGSRKLRIFLTAGLILVGAAQASGSPRPSIRSLSSLEDNERTQVLILATPHTGGMQELSSEHFSKLLEALDAWAPDAIGLERLSAKEILALSADPEMEAVIDQFVGGAKPIAVEAQAELGLSAASAARKMLEWGRTPKKLDAAELKARTLAALAAYEVETAVLYWRRASNRDGLSESIATFLERQSESMNERIAIGVALAERERHARLWSIDSHADKDLFLTLVEDLTAGLSAAGDAASIGAMSPYKETPEVQARALDAGDLLPLYSFMNSEQYAARDVRGQFDLFNKIDFPNDAGRAREAAWDERNYRIAANIRRVTAHHPGGRVLVIIGAGHKPFLDELLGVTLDVRIVHLDDLGAPPR